MQGGGGVLGMRVLGKEGSITEKVNDDVTDTYQRQLRRGHRSQQEPWRIYQMQATNYNHLQLHPRCYHRSMTHILRLGVRICLLFV